MRRLCILAALASTVAWAADRPRLAVVLVVDQLSAEAFRDHAPHARAGLKRLLDTGLVFDELRYEAAPTITSVGHATLMTGCSGETHGIVANEWIDGATGAATLSTGDPAYQVLGREAMPHDGTAPTLLLAPTLGDSVKLHDARAKVVAISGKDRSAMLSVGKSADAAVWLDAELPMFTSSTFYAKQLPAWVAPANTELQKLVAAGAFAWGLPGGGTTGQNPQPTRHGDSEPLAENPALQPTIDKLEVDLALAVTDALELGKDDAVDLLVVSFSGNDRIGHAFGPLSPRHLEEFLVVDQQVGRLLDGLDKKVGKGRFVVMLSSDHGVAPMPEDAKARGLDAGRVDRKALTAAVEAAADKVLGKGDWFLGVKKPGLYAVPARRERLMRIRDQLREAARTVPGVLDLLPLPDVMAGCCGSEGAMWKLGAYPGRTGDFLVVTKPYWVMAGQGGTGHASTYLYDRAVPLVLAGPGVPKGRAGVAHAMDVAPTLAKLIDVPPPAAARGRPLSEVFK